MLPVGNTPKPGPVTRATVREVAELGHADDWLGALARRLALEFDNAGSDVAGLLACGKELRLVLAEMHGSPGQRDDLERLRRRRSSRRSRL